MIPGLWCGKLDGWSCHSERGHSGERDLERREDLERYVLDLLGLRCSWEIQVERFLSCWVWTPQKRGGLEIVIWISESIDGLHGKDMLRSMRRLCEMRRQQLAYYQYLSIGKKTRSLWRRMEGSGKRRGQKTSGVVCSSIQGKEEFQEASWAMWNNTQKCLIKQMVLVPSPCFLSSYQCMQPDFQLPKPASLWFWTFSGFQNLLCPWIWGAGNARELRHTTPLQTAFSWWLTEAGVPLLQLPCPLSDVTLRCVFYAISQSSLEED